MFCGGITTSAGPIPGVAGCRPDLTQLIGRDLPPRHQWSSSTAPATNKLRPEYSARSQKRAPKKSKNFAPLQESNLTHSYRKTMPSPLGHHPGVIVAVVMTAIITPIVTSIYQPARRFVPYKRRSIRRSKPDAELRVLVCIHTPRNVPTIINLLEASHPTEKSQPCIYVLHLVDLTGRTSSMLIVHNTRKSGRPALKRTQAQSDHIINAFENFEQHVGCVSVQPLTAISPYSTMHEDICGVAEDKRVAFVIIPFHKQQTLDGEMEATNPAFRTINQNVLANAPCSIGILVDRGLSGTTRLSANQ
ncbi:unnamed protein product [Camellia sinensis]